MTTQIRRRLTTARWIASLGIALVAFSANAQIKRSPPIPANPGGVILGTQAHPLSAPQTRDAHEANYEFLSIDPQGKGHCYTDAHGLNNARQVVVLWTDDCITYNTHASLWDEGKWTSLDFVDPNCPDAGTGFESLNNRGIAFGAYWSYTCNYATAAGIHVKTGRWFVLPDIKGLPYNQGISMSNNGRATGAASDTIMFNVNKHWIWDGGKYLFPIFPANWDVSGFWAGPLFINDSGPIAGQYVENSTSSPRYGRMRGYFQDGSEVTTFDAPGEPPMDTYVNGITNSGDVLLSGCNPYPACSNFSWRRGVFAPLPNVPFPDAVETSVFGLNERGNIRKVGGQQPQPRFCGLSEVSRRQSGRS